MSDGILHLARLHFPGLSIYQLEYRNDAFTLATFEQKIPLPVELSSVGQKRKIEYLAGRLCLAEGLKDLGLPIEIPSASKGRAPRWPKGLTGSITHSQGWAMAALTRVERFVSVGIDTEPWMKVGTANNISKKIASSGELVQYARYQSKFSLAQYLTFLFSAKESIFKALNPLVGKYFSFDAVEIKLTKLGEPRFQFKLTCKLSAQFPCGWSHWGTFSIDENRITTLVALDVGSVKQLQS